MSSHPAQAPGPAPAGSRYCLITPCRNEGRHVRATLESTTRQSLTPALWIVVDDGSTDDSVAIVEEYAARFPYIRLLRLGDRGHRSVGPGVVEAFYAGLEQVDLDAYDFVCKFDADLELPPEYFARAVARMRQDPYLGNYSGKLYQRLPGGSLVPERTGDENAVGPVKFYRTRCFREIGGFVREVSWDGIDGHVCRMHDWIARSEDDPDMRIVHLRPMGSSQGNLWTGRLRWGRGKYFMGSAWYFVLASAISRVRDRPWVTGGAGILAGYLREVLRRGPRYEARGFRAHLRRFEWSCLLRGKRRTLERYESEIRQRRTLAGGEA